MNVASLSNTNWNTYAISEHADDTNYTRHSWRAVCRPSLESVYGPIVRASGVCLVSAVHAVVAVLPESPADTPAAAAPGLYRRTNRCLARSNYSCPAPEK